MSDYVTLALLVTSFIVTLVSVLMLVFSVIKSTEIEEIDISLDDKPNIEHKEKDILLLLIKAYNNAQRKIISKSEIKSKKLIDSTRLLVVGFMVLLVSILTTFFSNSYLPI